jgi:hypothetical protein
MPLLKKSGLNPTWLTAEDIKQGTVSWVDFFVI